MAPTADLSYESGQHSQEIPSAMESEKRIAELAPKAVRVLEAHQATDLYETLGLSNYVRNNHGQQ